MIVSYNDVPKAISLIFIVFIPVKILNPDGTQAQPNELGRIVVKLPLPPGNMSTLYKNDDLFEKVYFQKYPVMNFLNENN